jgi:3-oxoacyl-[acyl-carrier protein] reductase
VDLGLAGRTALVCGASSGLGLASAEALAEEGANVVLFARRAEQLEENARRLDGVAVVGDVREDADLERAVTTTVDRFGGLDIVVWNGGGPPPGKAEEMDDASLEAGYRLVLRPAVTLVRLCLPHLERSPAGRIVALSSLAAQEPTTHLALSNTFRPGVHGWLKTLSREVGPKGITVNCVAPGFMTSAMTDALTDAQKEGILSRIPTGAMGSGDDIGAAVVYLASKEAGYVTGQTLHVNGGMAMP